MSIPPAAPSYSPHSTVVPGQLTVLTTNECNARCAHCLMRSGPERAESLDQAQMIDSITAAHAAKPLSVVVFAGGEPTLLGEDLLEAIAFASCLGIGTRLVTNASWATDESAARAMIERLREAGLDELNISADDFHLPFIKLSAVVNAWHASKGAGFLSVVIAVAEGPGSKLTAETLMEALGEQVALVWDDGGDRQELPPPAPDGTRYIIANNMIYRIGRGRGLKEAYAVYPEAQAALDLPCPWAVHSSAISAGNHLVACCGIEAEGNEVLDFGSLDEASLPELVARANADPLLLGVAMLGPMRLMQLAREADPSLEFRSRYSAICEICEDVTANPAAVAALKSRAQVLWRELAAAKVGRLLAGADQPRSLAEQVAQS